MGNFNKLVYIARTHCKEKAEGAVANAGRKEGNRQRRILRLAQANTDGPQVRGIR